MALINEEDASFGAVAAVLKTDAALSAEVLRMANSPLGGRYGADTILQALSMLGLARIGGLVLTLSVSAFLKIASKSELMRRCWRHNLSCALAARAFSESFDLDPDRCYTAGLLHDVGRLALLATDTRLYEKVIQEGGDIRRLERELFGLDHCAAGDWLIREWRLPSIYADVARQHHDGLSEGSPLINLIHVACTVSNHLGYGVEKCTSDEPFEAVVSDELNYSIAATINAIECEYQL